MAAVNTSGAELIKIVFAFLLPPVAVALENGAGFHFLLSIVLTLMFVFPGILHALYIVLA